MGQTILNFTFHRFFIIKSIWLTSRETLAVKRRNNSVICIGTIYPKNPAALGNSDRAVLYLPGLTQLPVRHLPLEIYRFSLLAHFLLIREQQNS